MLDYSDYIANRLPQVDSRLFYSPYRYALYPTLNECWRRFHSVDFNPLIVIPTLK